jgi:hypothetical protein
MAFYIWGRQSGARNAGSDGMPTESMGYTTHGH